MGIASLLAVLQLTTTGALTLDDALALAARRSAELEVARADEEAAAVEARASYQGVLPRLDLTASFGRQFEGAQQQVQVVPNPAPPPDFVRVPVTIPANQFNTYQAGVNLTWTLFDGLASWNAIAASRTRAEATRRQYDDSALQVAFDVTRRFYDVVKQQRALEVLRETAAQSAELVRRADALFSAARGTKADTYAARVNLGNDELAVRAQVAALARARVELAAAIGIASDAGLEVVPPAPALERGPRSAAELPSLSALVAAAHRGRPLLAARKLAGDAADRDVSRARGAYAPTIGVQASYSKQALELGGANGLFGSLSNQYAATAQVTVSWNLFAGGETRSGVQRAEAQARRAQALVQQGEQTVVAELTTARAQVEALSQSVATAQENLDAAEKGLRAARERLDAGVGSQLEVRDAALKLAQAKRTAFDTVADLAVARADLRRAVGGSL
jgi:outer membrane protein